MSKVFEHSGVVRWSETDASGKFHYPSAMIWAEEAEHNLCRSLDAAYTPEDKPRRAVSALYNSPFVAGDSFLVRLWVEKMGKSSIRFGWFILNGDVVAVEGSHTVINLGGDRKPSAWPECIATSLAAYLKDSSDV